MTSANSWRVKLHRRLTQAHRLAVIGVGNELRGDDAAGVAAARALHAALQPAAGESPLIIDAGVAPENFTGALRRFAPDLVLIFDAAHMSALPGAIYLCAPDDTGNLSLTTHTLSFHLLAAYLDAELGCPTLLLAIQAEQDTLGAGLSPAVRRGVRRSVRAVIEAIRAAQVPVFADGGQSRADVRSVAAGRRFHRSGSRAKQRK